MEYYLLMDYWAQQVRDFKDSEKEHGIDAYETESMARTILDYIRYTRFRQWNLFAQRRGEEYEKLIEKLVERGFDPTSVERFVEEEERWKTTLEMGAQ
jgi:SOS response regulatory protein OraA/RecX